MRLKLVVLLALFGGLLAALSGSATAQQQPFTLDAPAEDVTHLSFPLTLSGTVDPTLDWSDHEDDGLRFFVDVVPWFATGPIEFDEDGNWSVTITHEMMDNPDGFYDWHEVLVEVGGVYGENQYAGENREYRLAPEQLYGYEPMIDSPLPGSTWDGPITITGAVPEGVNAGQLTWEFESLPESQNSEFGRTQIDADGNFSVVVDPWANPEVMWNQTQMRVGVRIDGAGPAMNEWRNYDLWDEVLIEMEGDFDTDPPTATWNAPDGETDVQLPFRLEAFITNEEYDPSVRLRYSDGDDGHVTHDLVVLPTGTPNEWRVTANMDPVAIAGLAGENIELTLEMWDVFFQSSEITANFSVDVDSSPGPRSLEITSIRDGDRNVPYPWIVEGRVNGWIDGITAVDVDFYSSNGDNGATIIELRHKMTIAVTEGGSFRAVFDPRLMRGWRWQPNHPIHVSIFADDTDPWTSHDSFATGVSFQAERVRAYCRGHAGTVYLEDGDLPTEGKDIIIGTTGNDRIDGLRGDDVICGLEGADVIVGGKGHDIIDGGPNRDRIRSGPGNDVVYGGSGSDRIRLGNGTDHAEGEGGRDVIYGDRGYDLIAGQGGNDRLLGGPGDDVVMGGSGRNTGSAGNGLDRCTNGTYAGCGQELEYVLVKNDRILIENGPVQGGSFDWIVFDNPRPQDVTARIFCMRKPYAHPANPTPTFVRTEGGRGIVPALETAAVSPSTALQESWGQLGCHAYHVIIE